MIEERENELRKGRQHLAEFLFDGDKEKAKQLLVLIESFVSPVLPPEFKRKMLLPLPKEDCRWCSKYSGECLYYMPDSMFNCEGECELYEKREDVNE